MAIQDPGNRIYQRQGSIVFLKTKEAFGGLSNMCAGYPLKINNIHIRTSEALYQACRFPQLPEVQKYIIAQASPMKAKMVSKPHRKNTRPDWEKVRVRIMKWCLRVKLAQNWEFSELLLSTGSKVIIEESKKDAFWGAKSIDEMTLEGANVLGRLLMELRELIQDKGDKLLTVYPPEIPEFLLLGRPIGVINEKVKTPDESNIYSKELKQINLF